MGLLFRLLTLPVTGPVQGVAWVAEQVAAMAEDEMRGPDLQTQLAELERARTFGEIDDDEYRRLQELAWDQYSEGASLERHDGRGSPDHGGGTP